MPLQYPDILESNNTSSKGYPIVRGTEIGGQQIVDDLQGLYSIYEFILSPTYSHDYSEAHPEYVYEDAIGYTVYVRSEEKFYKLVDWTNRKNSEGWEIASVPLNDSGKIDTQYLPSYVDDVIEGYYEQNPETEEWEFWTAETPSTLIVPEKGKIYLDVTIDQETGEPKNDSYRWTGESYYKISSPMDVTEDVTEGSKAVVTSGGVYEELQDYVKKDEVAKPDWEEDDTTDPAHVLNRPAIRKGTGTNSIVEGKIDTNVACDEYSHAEGKNTLASGVASHAEGTGSTSEANFTYMNSNHGQRFRIDGDYRKYKNSYIKYNDEYYEIKDLAYVSGANDYSVFVFDESFINYDFTGEFVSGQAAGDYSHSEGWGTLASGNNSHAEGTSTSASGTSSHAEGSTSIATGDISHAEGLGTKASGGYSHSEGWNTVAAGLASHAEGLGTNAKNFQHVSGTYNIIDNIDGWVANTQYYVGDYVAYGGEVYICLENNNFSAFRYDKWEKTNGKTRYAEIIGNGTEDNARSNARTLDWKGNEVLSGNLTVNGTTLTVNGQQIEPQVQADWEENDTNSKSHILNRTHSKKKVTYIDFHSSVVMSGETSFSIEQTYIQPSDYIYPPVGTYVLHVCIGDDYETQTNLIVSGDTGFETSGSFSEQTWSGGYGIVTDSSLTISFSGGGGGQTVPFSDGDDVHVYVDTIVYETLDERYIPDTITRNEDLAVVAKTGEYNDLLNKTHWLEPGTPITKGGTELTKTVIEEYGDERYVTVYEYYPNIFLDYDQVQGARFSDVVNGSSNTMTLSVDDEYWREYGFVCTYYVNILSSDTSFEYGDDTFQAGTYIGIEYREEYYYEDWDDETEEYIEEWRVSSQEITSDYTLTPNPTYHTLDKKFMQYSLYPSESDWDYIFNETN